MELLVFLLFVSGLLVLLVFLGKWKHNYWSRRGVEQIQPEFFFGNSRKIVQDTPIVTAFNEFYHHFKSRGVKHGGVYSLYFPFWIPIDVNLIKEIMVKDFSHFTDHGIFHHKNDLLSYNLFNLEGKEWREMRNKVSPLFSPAKIKSMFEIINEKSKILVKLIEQLTNVKEPVDIKEILLRFTNDITGSVVFGIECNSLEDPECEFHKYAKLVFLPRPLRFLIEGIVPWEILGRLGYSVFGGSGIEEFFSKIIKATIKYRKDNSIKRRDLFQLIMDLGNNEESANTFNKAKSPEAELIKKLTVDEIIAQSFIFWSGGFETSATTMTFAFLELARNPKIQKKLRQEIIEVINKHGGVMTYDAIADMKYLEMVIEETLRMYPPFGLLPRKCTKNFQIAGENVVIEKGTRLFIPIEAIQRDPDYYSNPDSFNPENFSFDNKADRLDMTWLAFGEGPRMCIGLKLGLLQTKVGIVSIIKDFRILLNEKTIQPLKFNPNSIVTTITGGLWVNIEKI